MTFQRDLAWQQIGHSHRSSISYQFARYALTLNFSLLPEDVIHQAKRAVLDALGCAIGAYEALGRTICEDAVEELGGKPEATVFCSGLRTNATNASLVNSFLVRFLDYNDKGGGGHNSDAISSILAVAEREQVGGKDFLTSVVISYELGARFQGALTKNWQAPKGWTSDIRGGLNQPPALGKLMKLNEEQIANAIGICLSHALPLGILDSDGEENTMAKNLRFGWVAHDAILACILAKKGFTGPVRIVESDVGIRETIFQGDLDLERLIDFSGWRMRNIWFKGVAACAELHAPIFATLGIIKEQDLKPDDIGAVRIKLEKPAVNHTTAPPKKYPRNAESADHSVFYATALAIKERAFGPDSFKPEKFTDSIILDLIEKISVEVDSSLGHFQGSAEILTKDGRRFYKLIEDPHGSANDPLTDKELEEKFKEMATKHMRDEHINKIFDTCWNIEKLNDLSKLTQLMIFPPSNS